MSTHNYISSISWNILKKNLKYHPIRNVYNPTSLEMFINRTLTYSVNDEFVTYSILSLTPSCSFRPYPETWETAYAGRDAERHEQHGEQPASEWIPAGEHHIQHPLLFFFIPIHLFLILISVPGAYSGTATPAHHSTVPFGPNLPFGAAGSESPGSDYFSTTVLQSRCRQNHRRNNQSTPWDLHLRPW